MGVDGERARVHLLADAHAAVCGAETGVMSATRKTVNCPACLAATFTLPRSYPDAVTSPIGPPTITGTEVTHDG